MSIVSASSEWGRGLEGTWLPEFSRVGGNKSTDGWGMCLEMKLYQQDIIEGRMKDEVYHGRKRLHMLSDVSSLAKYQEVKEQQKTERDEWL